MAAVREHRARIERALLLSTFAVLAQLLSEVTSLLPPTVTTGVIQVLSLSLSTFKDF